MRYFASRFYKKLIKWPLILLLVLSKIKLRTSQTCVIKTYDRFFLYRLLIAQMFSYKAHICHNDQRGGGGDGYKMSFSRDPAFSSNYKLVERPCSLCFSQMDKHSSETQVTVV
jgi:hypothetical protein